MKAFKLFAPAAVILSPSPLLIPVLLTDQKTGKQGKI